jgi:dimethylargininase
MLIALTRAVSASLADCELTWLDRQPIDIDKARAQHHAYEACLAECGARVISLPPLDEHPDAVFVEDPALVLDEVAVITTLGVESRKGERHTLADALAQFRPVFHMQEPAKLEGGDVMRVGRTLYAGLSARTDLTGVDHLRDLLAPYNYRVETVELRNCLHLKSACTHLGQGVILANRDWIEPASLAKYRILDVDPSEPAAANVLRVDETVIMPDAFPRTAQRLRAVGYQVRTLNLSELLKAESGVTCSCLLFDS